MSSTVPEDNEKTAAGTATLVLDEKSDVQLEPTQEEMERERLTSKAEQVPLCCCPPPSHTHTHSPLS